MALPSTYKELTWLGSTGTQYINTGFKPNNNTRINAYINVQSLATWIIGSRRTYREQAFALSGNYNGDTSRMFFNYGTSYYTPAQIFTIGTYANLDFNKNQLYKDGNLVATAATATFTSNYNIYLFGGNDNGTASINPQRIKWAKIYDNGTLVRDYVPSKRISDGVVGLYDLVNDVFYTNAGSGIFEYEEKLTVSAVANPVGSGTFTGTGDYNSGTTATLTAIPNPTYSFVNWKLEGYTKLDYLQSTGTQCLDTKVSFTSNPTNTSSVEMKFNAQTFSGQAALCGCENNGNTWNFAVQFYNGVFRNYHGTLSAWQSVTLSANTDYTLYMSQSSGVFTRKINNTTVTGSTNMTGASRTFTLFADSTTNYGYNQFCSAKIYYCKIYNNGVLVRDYIPVIRHSDMAIGMLDVLNMVFYGNTGTGLFQGGAL